MCVGRREGRGCRGETGEDVWEREEGNMDTDELGSCVSRNEIDTVLHCTCLIANVLADYHAR